MDISQKLEVQQQHIFIALMLNGVTLVLIDSGIESMKMGPDTQALSRSEKEALIRAKYLSEQSLGHFNLVDLTGTNPRSHLDPFSHHNYVPVMSEPRSANARVHSKGYEFSEEAGVQG
jgi:hypothetical protein